MPVTLVTNRGMQPFDQHPADSLIFEACNWGIGAVHTTTRPLLEAVCGAVRARVLAEFSPHHVGGREFHSRLTHSVAQNRELQIMKQLKHTNVVELKDCFYSKGDKVRLALALAINSHAR